MDAVTSRLFGGNVHVYDGRCFQFGTIDALETVLEWVDRENVVTVEMDLIDPDNDHWCEVYESDQSKALKGQLMIGVHGNHGCVVVPITIDTVKPIVREFIVNPDVIGIEVWCKGFLNGTDCTCHEQLLERIRRSGIFAEN